MKIRRTISIEKSDVDTLKPFLDATGNNLSLALRNLIDYYRQETDMNKITGDQQRLIMLRNQVIEKNIGMLMPLPLIKWLYSRNLGVPPLGIFRGFMEKYTKLYGIDNPSLNDYINMLNKHAEVFGYKVRYDIRVSPDFKSSHISFEGEDSEKLKHTVACYSCFLAHHPIKWKIKKLIEAPNLFIIDYDQCDSEEEAYGPVREHFGHDQFLLDEIHNNFHLWRNIACILKADNYEDVIISRDILLQLFKFHDFSDHLNYLISIIYGVSIENTDYQHITRYIDEICKTNGLIHKIEYNDNEMKIYHKFNNENIIHTINDTILNTLEMSGQHFILKKSDKITILNRRQQQESRYETLSIEPI